VKLDPKQIRFRTSFLAGLSRATVAFAAKRATIHLHETAMVLEGEQLQFQYLGLERFFARAVSEYSTVTVPYSRLTKVKYRRKLVVRGLLVLIGGFFTLLTASAQFQNVGRADLVGSVVLFSLISALVWLVVFLCFRLVPPTYTVEYRNPDRAKRRFTFAIRTRAVRREFDAVLKKYRESAGKFAGGGSK
jgi:hypothetical protein